MMMAMIPMKGKLWMSGVEWMEDGVDAYFFRAVKSDCNGYYLLAIDIRYPVPL